MRVAVFTGSAEGTRVHQDAVRALARDLAASGVGIVYGGGRVGLMGVLADSALAAGGEVLGVMPQHLVDGEIAHQNLTRLDVVAGMHERKARMSELADAFVALPGGAGTLEELFEVWTWGQLGLHAKPTALLDPDGFFAPLLAQLDVMSEAGYLGARYRASLGVVLHAAGLLDFIARYRHPQTKWAQSSPAATQASRLTSVGWVHLDEEGRRLAVRTRGRDRYYLPGGKLELGESLEQALRREVLEELHVHLGDVRPAFTVTAPAHGLDSLTELTMHCFHGRPDGQPRPGREIQDLAWLEGPTDPRAAPAVREVLNRLAAT